MPFKEAIRTYDYTSSDPRQYRLWSAVAQPYASGDQLARYFQEGWHIKDEIAVETHWFGEARFITLYHVELYRDGEQVLMRVMGSPFTRQLVNDERLGLTLVPYSKPAPSVKFEVINK
jgi:hypothetical protein